MKYPTKLDAALAHAREGFRVFPLIPNMKRPLFRGWQAAATTDESRIRQWWKSDPDANIGISCDGLLVIDIDPRNGGRETIKKLSFAEDFPHTRVSETWSGGHHMIYRLPPGVELQNGEFAAGVDIKTNGGLIVAPGSTVDGNEYKWVAMREIVEGPQWVVDGCAKAVPKSELAGKRVCPENEHTIEMLEHYLATRAPEASEGNRDTTAVAVFNRFYDFAAEIPTAMYYGGEWNATHSFPSLEYADIERIAYSAAKTRHKPIGCSNPLAPGFDPVEIDETKRPTPEQIEPEMSQTEKKKFEPIKASVGAKRALTHSAKPLIKGLLTRGGLSIVYGPPNSGKSFIGLDFSRHIGAGESWAGKKVHKGAVLYVAAEGGESIFARLAALEQRYGQLDDCALHILAHPVDLLHGVQDADAIIAAAKQIETEGLKVELIVIDTVARAMSGGDENSSQDMGAFIKHLDRVRAGVGCHVSGIHHTGKDKTRGARGHSSLLGAVDTEIEVDGRSLKVTKQRDMERVDPIYFTLKPCRIGVDDEGDDVTSCYVELRDREAGPVQAPLGVEEQWFKDRLAEKMLDIEQPFSGDLCLVVLAEMEQHFGVSPSMSRAAVLKRSQRMRDNLVTSGHLRQVSANYWQIVSVTR